MKKQEYIKPEMMVEELETVEMIASSLEFVDGEYANTKEDQLSAGRRGKWGNLWYTEQE